jgi:hypothetical protein
MIGAPPSQEPSFSVAYVAVEKRDRQDAGGLGIAL